MSLSSSSSSYIENWSSSSSWGYCCDSYTLEGFSDNKYNTTYDKLFAGHELFYHDNRPEYTHWTGSTNYHVYWHEDTQRWYLGNNTVIDDAVGSSGLAYRSCPEGQWYSVDGLTSDGYMYCGDASSSSESSESVGNTSSSSSSSYSSSSSSYIQKWSSSSSSSSYIQKWSSSSSSSSSSSEGYSSSSSSSLVALTRNVRSVLIEQNNHNLIPFAFIGEHGYEKQIDESVLNFVVSSENTSIIDYDEIININNTNNTSHATMVTNDDVYLPQKSDSIRHNSVNYVDLISKDINGIKSVNARTELERYDFESIDNVFFIPKFSWSDNSLTTTTTTIIPLVSDSFWVGDGNWLKNIKYDRDSSSLIYEKSLSSNVNNVVLDNYSNKIYVSTNSYLRLYSVNKYESSDDKEVEVGRTIPNEDQYIIDLYANGNVWAVDSYKGNVAKLDSNSLSNLHTYEGFDAPFKIVWSSYHNTYFIAGSFFLWQLDDSINDFNVVYEINGFKLNDFDVSDSGEICMVFKGIDYDIIRIVDKDLYTFILDERVTDSNLKFCKYCEVGKFYILGELNSNQLEYLARHYIFDLNSKVLEFNNTSSILSTTTTTTTEGVTSQPIQVEFPNGGEQLQIGKTYEIKWISDKSVNDSVKIELYHKGEFHSLIVDSTLNNGVYNWTIPTQIDSSKNYKIQITWLSASSNSGNVDKSDEDFEIDETVNTTTTSTTTLPSGQAIGIDYDKNNKQILILLQSGLYGLFDIFNSSFYGLIETNISNPLFITVQNVEIGQYDRQDKVRVFVGSEKYYNDKWDSGIIETDLTSMYYGGGNNLNGGHKYYVHIQTYSKNKGWSNIQIKEFVMPK